MKKSRRIASFLTLLHRSGSRGYSQPLTASKPLLPWLFVCASKPLRLRSLCADALMRLEAGFALRRLEAGFALRRLEAGFALRRLEAGYGLMHLEADALRG